MKIKQQDPSKVIIIPRPPQSMASQVNSPEVNGEVLSDQKVEEPDEAVVSGHQTPTEESKNKEEESKRD